MGREVDVCEMETTSAPVKPGKGLVTGCLKQAWTLRGQAEKIWRW